VNENLSQLSARKPLHGSENGLFLWRRLFRGFEGNKPEDGQAKNEVHTDSGRDASHDLIDKSRGTKRVSDVQGISLSDSGSAWI